MIQVELSTLSGTAIGRVHPQKAKISLRESGESTVEMDIEAGEAGLIEVGTRARVVYPNEDWGYYVVSKAVLDADAGTIKVTLVDALKLLEEQIAWGDFYANDMGGSGGVVPIGTAIAFMLSKQSTTYAAFGTSDCSDSQGWHFQNSDILGAITTMMEAVKDCWLEVDYSQSPWVINLRKYDFTAPTIELRANRNIAGMSITQDRNGMYTRCYPLGKKNITIESVNSGVAYLDSNTERYGVIEEVISDTTISDKSLLLAWAQKQLASNSYPAYTIQISGRELYKLTGESSDRIRVGQVAAVNVGGGHIVEHVAALTWENAVKNDVEVKITIAREIKTLSGVLNKRGGGGGKKKSKDDQSDNAETESNVNAVKNGSVYFNGSKPTGWVTVNISGTSYTLLKK